MFEKKSRTLYDSFIHILLDRHNFTLNKYKESCLKFNIYLLILLSGIEACDNDNDDGFNI